MAVLKINAHTYRKYLSESAKPVLVEFSAPWCSYCRRINPAYEKVAAQYGDELAVVKVNIDDEPLVAEQEHIEVIPTLVLYKDGKALGSIVAPESKAAIDAFIQETLR